MIDKEDSKLILLPWKEVHSSLSKGITKGTRLKVISGSDAEVVEVIGVFNTGNTAKRYVSAGCGDIIKVAVKKGKLKGKMETAMVTTTRMGFFRDSEGITVRFEENTCILVQKQKTKYHIKDSKIKGIVAKECLEVIPLLKKNAIIR
jgi:ribosomal protein L14